MANIFKTSLFISYYVVQEGFDDNRKYIVRLTRAKNTETKEGADFYQVSYNNDANVLEVDQMGFGVDELLVLNNCFTNERIAKKYVNDVVTMAMLHLQDVVTGAVPHNTLSHEKVENDGVRIEVFHSDFESVEVPLASGGVLTIELM